MSEKDRHSGTQLDRRSFLKGVAATGAMAGLAGAHPISAAQSAGGKAAAEKSWRDKPDPIDEKLISDGGTYDVVVIGGGASGINLHA